MMLSEVCEFFFIMSPTALLLFGCWCPPNGPFGMVGRRTLQRFVVIEHFHVVYAKSSFQEQFMNSNETAASFLKNPRETI